MKSPAFIVYLATLSAFGAFSTDIYLASMPTIQHLFHTSVAHVQLTLSLFFICFAVGQLFWGPLSDRIGRKKVIFIGVTIFTLGSLACAWSSSITQLIIARLVQGFGACSGIVMSMSVAKDSFHEPKQLTKVLSGVMGVTMLAPMIAPTVGSYLLVHINWQSNFYFLVAYGVLIILGTCFVKESYPKAARKPLPVNLLWQAYKTQIKHRPYLWMMLAVGTNSTVLLAFITSSSFIYIKIYHIAAELFGYLFALNAAALICGTLSINSLKSRFKDSQIIFLSLSITLLGSVLMLGALLFYPSSILSVILPLFLTTYGVGILFPQLTGLALQNVLTYAGIASALIGTSRFGMAAVIGWLMGILITHSAFPLAVVMLIFNLLTAGLVLIYFKAQSLAQQKL